MPLRPNRLANNMSRLFAPLLWWVGTATSDPLEQSAWERGKATVGRGHPMVIALAAALTTAASTSLLVASQSAPIRTVLSVVAWLLGWLLVPIIWAGLVALSAPVKQRDDARLRIAQLNGETQEAQTQTEQSAAAMRLEHESCKRSLDRIYQNALRWALLAEFRELLGDERVDYFLARVDPSGPDPNMHMWHRTLGHAREALRIWTAQVVGLLDREGREDLSARFMEAEGVYAPTDPDHPGLVNGAYRARLRLLNMWAQPNSELFPGLLRPERTDTLPPSVPKTAWKANPTAVCLAVPTVLPGVSVNLDGSTSYFCPACGLASVSVVDGVMQEHESATRWP